jgi:hypothetical protein
MKLHSLFFILMLSLFSCSTGGDVDTTEQEGTDTVDTVIVDAPTGGVVDAPVVTAPTKKNKPLLVEKDLPKSPDGTVVEMTTEEEEQPLVTAPIFFDCEIKKRAKAQMRCSEKSLQTYVEEHIEFVGEEKSEHYASVRIVIRPNGSTGTVTVLGTSDEQFGAAVVKTIRNLNVDGLMWTPAYKDSVAVAFDYYTEFEINY